MSDRGFPLWHHLRSIGNSSLAKMTIVIPLVGYLILFNYNVQDFLRLSIDFPGFAHEVNFGLLRLFSIYFGLCFIALASTLFACFCPLEIKKYVSAVEYIAGDEQHMSFHRRGEIERLIKDGDAKAQSLSADLYALRVASPTIQTPAEFDERRAEFFRVSMQLYFEMLDRSLAAIRWAVTIFYGIGFIALSAPALLVFLRVSVVLFETARHWLGA